MDDISPSPFDRLLKILRLLRSPEGCAWDREQTPLTMRNNLIEEAYECVSAISSGDSQNLREELGDVFMIASLISLMMEESGEFTVSDVLEEICAKLIRRHPHVFSDARADTVQKIAAQWDAIKAAEKSAEKGPAGAPASTTALDGIPSSLPPLEKAAKIQQRVSKVGFDWDGPAPVWRKLEEEMKELSEAEEHGDRRMMEEEIGDILFTVVNLSRLMGVDPGLALHGTNEKFGRRFREVERRLRGMGMTTRDAGLARMDQIWDQVKREEKASK